MPAVVESTTVAITDLSLEQWRWGEVVGVARLKSTSIQSFIDKFIQWFFMQQCWSLALCPRMHCRPGCTPGMRPQKDRQSTGGRYASYWNAYLLLIIFQANIIQMQINWRENCVQKFVLYLCLVDFLQPWNLDFNEWIRRTSFFIVIDQFIASMHSDRQGWRRCEGQGHIKVTGNPKVSLHRKHEMPLTAELSQC